jgi:sulfite reductase beta subunit-like hemoprotein
MADRVDSHGNTSRDYNYSRHDKNPTRLEHMVKTLVVDELKKETEKAAKDVTEKARAVVASHVGRFISEQMVPAIEVQKS